MAPHCLASDPEVAYPYLFTVFTPTFNRASTLPRVYEGLKAQTCLAFEWLVVDDGSNDDTRALVAGWQRQADFPIRYIYQCNRGKHVAFNLGVREARGELFLTLDSDDACVPDALAKLQEHWCAIPQAEQLGFSAVTALCVDQNGNLVGNEYPSDITDSNTLEMFYKFKVRGEKWGFQRTDVLRQYPFPEDIEREYVPEGLVWSRISRRYKTRFINERLRVYFIDQPSMVRGQNAAKNAVGGQLEKLMVLNDDIDYFKYAPLEFCRSAAHYVRFSFHLGTSVLTQIRSLQNYLAKLLWVAMLPVGFLVYCKDQKMSGHP